MTALQCFVGIFLTVLLTCSVSLSQGNLLGGATDADKSDLVVQAAVQFAETEYNKKSNSMYYMRAEIIKAKKQVSHLISSHTTNVCHFCG